MNALCNFRIFEGGSRNHRNDVGLFLRDCQGLFSSFVIRHLAFLLAVALIAVRAPAQSTNAPATLAELQARLTEQAASPRFAAGTLGVKIVSLDTGKILFTNHAEKLFSPASNCKLYTVALALDKLGGDYRLATSLYATAPPDASGTLNGDLIVYGRGDPTLNARLHDGSLDTALAPFVAALTNAGIKCITGDLVGDESFFHNPPYGSGWDCDDLQFEYGAELSALTLNDNLLKLSVAAGERVGAPCRLALSPATGYVVLSNRTETIAKGGPRSIRLQRPLGQNVVYVFGQMPMGQTNYTDDVTVHNPAGLFVTLFQEALAWRGIVVQGRTRTVNWLDRQVQPLDFTKLRELVTVKSPPIRQLAREIQKPSQNLYTELLLLHVGALARASNTPPTTTDEEIGIRELEKFLAKAGVKRGDVQFDEGSGLSRNNLTTPNATIALLQFMSRHPEAETYRNALPIAGVDGTLRDRLRNPPAAGNVRAKTGTLRWANSLSGYVTTAAGERLAFSIMLNRYVAPDAQHTARAEIDRIAVLLAGFTGRSEP
jgi:serine-type D-Ala-D-Ala carboxypeptidase/endopeptidase (penicillin-binding protein 4)